MTTPRLMAIVFGVVALGASIYVLATLRPASPASEPSAPPPRIEAPAPPGTPAAPPPRVVAEPPPAPPAQARPAEPPPAAPGPAPLRITQAEDAELKPIVAAIRENLQQVKKDYEAGKLSKKQVGEELRKANEEAERELGRRLGAERGRQYLEVIRGGGEVAPSAP